VKSILIVFPYGSQYGPRRTLEHVTRAVTLAGFRPVCVVRSDDAVSPELAALEPAVRIVPTLGTVPRTLDPRRIARFVREHRAAAAAIMRIARAEDAAAVYTISEAVLAGGLAARRAGLPSATHVIGMSIRSPRLLARAYIPLLDRVSSRFVACSIAAAAMLTDNGVDRNAIDLVHNSISLAAVEASAHLPSPLPPDGPRVGMVAAYDPRKGHDLFVQAAALLAEARPEARFYLVGGVLDAQPESAVFELAVRRSIASRGLSGRVEQVGFIAPPELYAWLRALDVVVAPSRTEGFAHALLEAMACSRPIVATAVEGNLDALVHEESGLLVESTPEAIAAGVSSLLADPAHSAALGEAAHARVAAQFDEHISIPLLAETIAALGSIEQR
jgi:glycosyltransferase involved in cell wall biosynthesis